MFILGVPSIGQRLSLLLIGCVLCAVGVPALWAQSADRQSQLARCYVKKKQFNLPLNMSPQTRKELNEIRVFCLNNANGQWAQLAKCPPHHTGFNFEVPGEGEYCFTLCMVDKANRVIPPNPSQSQYKMVVVVDTTPPALDVRYIGTTNEGFIVELSVDDAHPDAPKTVVEYQLRNLDWRALTPMAPGTNRYCIPVQAAITGMIKITAADLAENVSCRDFDLNQLKNVAKQAPPSVPGDPASNRIPLQSPVAEAPTPPANVTPTNYVKPGPAVPNPSPSPMPSGPARSPKMDGIAPLPVVPIPVIPIEDVSDAHTSNSAVNSPKDTPSNKNNVVTSPPRLNEINPAEAAPIKDANDGIGQRLNPTSSNDVTPDILRAGATTPPTNPAAPNSPSPIGSPVTGSVSPAHAVGAQRKTINQRHMLLDYRLEQVGASGIGKVEIWITADQSQTWQKLREDVERKSPVAVELPGEGLYGITLVVSNGRGFGGTPPIPGDVPDIWVEVDMTRPIVKIRSIRTGGTEDPGTVHVTWSVRDRNLAADAVDLYYATKRDGNWSPITRGLCNDGHYRWAPPVSVGSQVYVRLVARDLAGNATVVETSQPVTVDDLSRPRGRLVGVAPASTDPRPEVVDH